MRSLSLLPPILLLACATGSGGNSAGSETGVPFGDANVEDAPNETPACFAKTSSATPVPLAIYVMMDQSKSMDVVLASGETQWKTLGDALTAFMNDPNSAALQLGLQYFPLQPKTPIPTSCSTDADCGLYGPCVDQLGCFPSFGDPPYSSCDPVDYATPEIEIAPLASTHDPIVASLAAHQPIGNTPTAPALQGAIDHLKSWGAAHLGVRLAVVFPTDGDPSDCQPQDVGAIAAIAKAGFDAGVKTFVVGVGSKLANLDAIAEAGSGGATSAFVIDTSKNVLVDFENALRAARDALIDCRYKIPATNDAGEPLDFGLVNVDWKAGDASTVAIPHVQGGAGNCGSGEGWAYGPSDDAPTSIVLCPTTCSEVRGDEKASVEIAIGCKTVIR